MFKMTNNLLKWMNSIIQSRISKSIFIQSYSLDHYEIVNVDDSTQKILVENNFSSFFESELGCSFLNYLGRDIGAPKEFPLVMPGNHLVDHDLLKETETGILVRYDFIGLFSWVLTRFEEINGERDKHGRFSALSSHAYKYNYLDRPIVDEWIIFLRQLCQHIWPNIVLSENEFSIHISHDVDTPSRYGYRGIKSFVRGVLFDVIRLRNYFSPLGAIRMRINNKKILDRGDSCNTFDFLMKSSEVRGLKSHFYFLIDNAHRQFDAEYDVCYPSIQKLIVEMKQRGHHVGVHSSYASIDDPRLMARHTEKFKDILSSNGLQQEVLGGRMHFLRWDHPNTLRACEYAGFDYDCSLGYPEFAGFRCGTCHSYEAFDLELDRSLNLILLPLIVMEATFLSASYLQLGYSDKSLAEFKRFKDICKKYNGTYTVLFHNTSVVTSQQQSFYERVLDC